MDEKQLYQTQQRGRHEEDQDLSFMEQAKFKYCSFSHVLQASAAH